MAKAGDTALVLEGGAFRGMFTAGVLDVLMEEGVCDFASVWGVSAGAIAAASFKARQIGRSMRIMLAFRDDRRFMSLWSFATTGDIAGSDFMYEEIQNDIDPMDRETFAQNPLRMYAVATDVVFGTAAYLPCTRMPDDIDKVRASASLPPVSRLVEVDAHRYLDGGTADSVPFAAALGLPGGAEVAGHSPAARAVVVLTQDRSYLKQPGSALAYEQLALRSHRYDAFPYYCEALRTRAERYNAQREELFALEEQFDSPVLVIAPEAPVEVGSSENSGEKLLRLYLQGRAQAERRLDEIRAFLV